MEKQRIFKKIVKNLEVEKKNKQRKKKKTERDKKKKPL